MSFRRFFLVRLAWAVFGLWLAATLVFLLFFVASRNPARDFTGGDQASPAAVEQARKDFHLDAPLYEQYGAFLWRLIAHQSAGSTLFQYEEGPYADSGELAREALPATLSLVVLALILSIGIAGLAGFALARVRWRRIYNVPIYIAIGLTPIFVGLELSYYLAFRWELTPISNYCDFFNPPADVGCGGAIDWLKHLVLPVVTLSLFFVALYTRVVRAGVLRVLEAKESDQRRRRGRHFVLALARLAGRDFGFVVGAALLVEVTFQIPGLGRGALISVYAQDYVSLQAYVLYGTFLAIAVHFLVDLIVGAFDTDLRADWPAVRLPARA